jgi:hypothetical protein
MILGFVELGPIMKTLSYRNILTRNSLEGVPALLIKSTFEEGAIPPLNALRTLLDSPKNMGVLL